MFDIKWIRENPEAFDAGLKRRGLPAISAELIATDEKRRAHVTMLQEMQSRRNTASKEIGKAMGAKDSALADKLKAEVATLKDKLQAGEDEERQLFAKAGASIIMLMLAGESSVLSQTSAWSSCLQPKV